MLVVLDDQMPFVDISTSPGDDSEKHDIEDDACFCCCSHVVAGYFSVDSLATLEATLVTRPDVIRNLHSSSKPNLLFRPPQIS